MKKILPIFIPLTFLVVWFLHGNVGPVNSFKPNRGEEELQPNALQKKVERLVFGILSSYHYRKVEVNDSLSSKIFDAYIENLDPNKVYFLASDIKDLERYRFQLDDELNAGELTAAFKIYSVYQQRLKQRFAFLFDQLKAMPDFQVAESYQPDREKAPFAPSFEELQAYWRKDLKRQMLDEKIGGKADTTILKDLTKRFKRSEKFMMRTRSEDVFQAFMNSYTETLDPHTSYMIPKVSQEFNKDMAQSFEGIGATLRLDGDYVAIVDLIPGGPASKSKQVQVKDRIVAVAQGDDGSFVDIVGWFTDEAVKLIRGPKGTVVRLKLLAAGAQTGAPAREVRIVRDKIKIEEQKAKKELLTQQVGNKKWRIGLITLPMFYRDFEGARSREQDYASTTADVKKFIQQFKAEGGIDALVLDLRNNGGGSLIEAINLTGLFISKGPVVQRKQSDGEINVESDVNPDVAYDGPLAVMINRFSASASEIFAGAIQDYRRGLILGEQSFGKGTVQSVVALDNYIQEKEPSGQLKITLEKFYRVTGSSTQLKGVNPDIAMPSAFDAKEYGESSQPSALPWDAIAAANFSPVDMVSPALIKQLQAGFELRLKNNADLIKLKKDLERWKKIKEKNMISLQWDQRKKELDEQKKNPDETEAIMESLSPGSEAEGDDAKKTDKHAKDVYLKETKNILADWLNLGVQKSAKLVSNP